MGRRGQHSSDQLRDLCLEAAEKIVRRKDPSALSLRKIAAEIAYAPSSLYLIFKNKDDLLLQLNHRSVKQLGEGLQKAFAAAKSDRRLEECCRHYLEFTLKNKGLWRLAFESTAVTGRRAEAWRKQVEDSLSPLFKALEAGLESYSSKDLERYRRGFWLALHGLAVLGAPDRGLVEMDRGLEGLIRSHSRMIKMSEKQGRV